MLDQIILIMNETNQDTASMNTNNKQLNAVSAKRARKDGIDIIKIMTRTPTIVSGTRQTSELGLEDLEMVNLETQQIVMHAKRTSSQRVSVLT